MREIRFDAASANRPRRRRSRRASRYLHGEFHNLGTIAVDPWIQLVTSKPKKLAKAVGTKYLSVDNDGGECDTVKYFAAHPGALCKPGDVAPGDSLTIVAKVRPSESLSHWIGTDYAHGGDNPIYDDNPHDNPFAQTKTTVNPSITAATGAGTALLGLIRIVVVTSGCRARRTRRRRRRGPPCR